MKTKIQVVCPVINLWHEYTKPCIDSVLNAIKDFDYNFLLIDQASTDDTQNEAQKLVNSNFSYKRNEKQLPLSTVWNYGIKNAFDNGFDYVFVINNDIILHPEAIKEIIKRFEKEGDNSNLAMITCMDVRGECDVNGGVNKIYEIDIESKKEIPEAEHPNFSAFMINKKCWDLVGEFDEGFNPAFFEDNDYHRRICLAGLKAIVLPTALFYHYGSRTWNNGINKYNILQKNLMFESVRSYFIAKWGGLPDDNNPGTNNLFLHPFNDVKKPVNWTLQKAHKQNCNCNVSCLNILTRFGKKYAD